MEDCPFCAIVEGRLPASVLAETENAIAFLDLRQAVQGHVLVVPRRHVESIYVLETDLAAELMQLAVRVAQALQVAMHPHGLNLWQSNGEAGGQEVPHFHLHVQPRRYDDGLLRIYPETVPEPASRELLDRLADAIRPHLAAPTGTRLP